MDSTSALSNWQPKPFMMMAAFVAGKLGIALLSATNFLSISLVTNWLSIRFLEPELNMPMIP